MKNWKCIWKCCLEKWQPFCLAFSVLSNVMLFALSLWALKIDATNPSISTSSCDNPLTPKGSFPYRCISWIDGSAIHLISLQHYIYITWWSKVHSHMRRAAMEGNWWKIGFNTKHYMCSHIRGHGAEMGVGTKSAQQEMGPTPNFPCPLRNHMPQPYFWPQTWQIRSRQSSIHPLIWILLR